MQKTIFELATEFRKAIDKTDRARLLNTMQDFPKGSCGDASLLLAKYFADNGHTGFVYMGGRFGESWHHWLQRGNLIVDITADQFEGNAQVIVSENSQWHADMNGGIGETSDYSEYRENVKLKYDPVYKHICLML